MTTVDRRRFLTGAALALPVLGAELSGPSAEAAPGRYPSPSELVNLPPFIEILKRPDIDIILDGGIPIGDLPRNDDPDKALAVHSTPNSERYFQFRAFGRDGNIRRFEVDVGRDTDPRRMIYGQDVRVLATNSLPFVDCPFGISAARMSADKWVMNQLKYVGSDGSLHVGFYDQLEQAEGGGPSAQQRIIPVYLRLRINGLYGNADFDPISLTPGTRYQRW